MTNQIEVPACWCALLNDNESAVALLNLAKQPPNLDDPDLFLKPVPMLLASIWESFHMRCLLEASMFIAGFSEEVNSIPNELKKIIATEIKKDKHDLAMWKLAGEGWKKVIRDRTEPDRLRLQSGKSNHINEFYKNGIGFCDVTDYWKMDRFGSNSIKAKIDAHIKKRDKIVHRGEEMNSIDECWDFYALIYEQSLRTVIAVNKFVYKCTGVKMTNASMRHLRNLGSTLSV